MVKVRRQTRSFANWRLWLDQQNILIIDVGTTGVAAHDKVTEVAVINTMGDLKFHGRGLHRKVENEIGVNSWLTIHRRLIRILDKAQALLAWNSNFDKRQLEQAANRYRLTMPSLPWRDLMRGYRTITGESPSEDKHTLETVLEDLNIKVPHKASKSERDCYAALAIMKKIAR